jgi:hypothetical protein
MLHFVEGLDKRGSHPGQVVFVTLTYPAVFPEPMGAKRHLNTILKRFERAFGRLFEIWKMEPQRRGAPHFHLLIWMKTPQGEADVYSLVKWWATNWEEVIRPEGEQINEAVLKVHFGEVRNGRPCVEAVKDWEGVSRYAGKYIGKVCSGHGWKWPGRWWGVRNRDLAPLEKTEYELPGAVAAVVNRMLRKLRRSQVTLSPKPGGTTGRVKVIRNAMAILGGKVVSRPKLVVRGRLDRKRLDEIVRMAGTSTRSPGVEYLEKNGDPFEDGQRYWEDFGPVQVVPIGNGGVKRSEKGERRAEAMARVIGNSPVGCKVFFNSNDAERVLAWACERCGYSLDDVMTYGASVDDALSFIAAEEAFEKEGCPI